MAGRDGPTPLVRVVHGNPDPEELAAITALLAVVMRHRPTGIRGRGGGGGAPPPPPPPRGGGGPGAPPP
ncbi:acyl-CoA carboxylase subunit epsilon, partial [Kitasatospora sp. NPDC059571]|uniref:acyl-CoA carboxylase subunit epsilon n=1 Tax=Kitasatospora sp. NPDC059571 TaxID=3346871 RepID=UPI0036C0C636